MVRGARSTAPTFGLNECAIYSAIRGKGWMSSAAVVAATKINARTARYQLRRLCELGLLEKSSSNPPTYRTKESKHKEAMTEAIGVFATALRKKE